MFLKNWTLILIYQSKYIQEEQPSLGPTFWMPKSKILSAMPSIWSSKSQEQHILPLTKWKRAGKGQGSSPSRRASVFGRGKQAYSCVKLKSVKQPTAAMWALQEMSSPKMRQAHFPLWFWNFQEKLSTTTKIRQGSSSKSASRRFRCAVLAFSSWFLRSKTRNKFSLHPRGEGGGDCLSWSLSQ